MKILVACECSGVVRDAFIEEGHDAISWLQYGVLWNYRRLHFEAESRFTVMECAQSCSGCYRWFGCSYHQYSKQGSHPFPSMEQPLTLLKNAIQQPTNKVMPFAKPNGTRLSDVVIYYLQILIKVLIYNQMLQNY